MALVTYQLIFPSSSYSLRYTKMHVHRDAGIMEPEPLYTIMNLPLATDWGKEHEKEIKPPIIAISNFIQLAVSYAI